MERMARFLPQWTIVLAGTVLVGAGATQESFQWVEPHGASAIYPIADVAKRFPAGGTKATLIAAGIEFTITYEDQDSGFLDPAYGAEARRCLEDVLSYVAEILDYESGALDILVNPSEFDGTGALASAGTVFLLYPGIHPGATLYRLNTGEKLLEGAPEIGLTVDFGRKYALGVDPPANDELDFTTVLLHEITHGIGFITRIGPKGQSQLAPGAYSVYDALLTDVHGAPIISLEGLVPVFQADASVLTNYGVGFAGINAVAQLGLDIPVPVYAAPPFSSGTSIGHWAVGNVVGDVLMEPSLSRGVMHREYTPRDLGAVLDIRNYSRGDGRPGDGPKGCNSRGDNEETGNAGGDWMLLGMLLMGLFAGRRVTGARL